LTPLEDDIHERLQLQAYAFEELLGEDLIDPGLLNDRLVSRARYYAAQITGPNIHTAAQTAIDLGNALSVDLQDPEEWSTPLGRACALTFEHTEVGATAAAKILGVSRARVYQLLDTGKLDRRGDGITRASIARRIAAQEVET